MSSEEEQFSIEEIDITELLKKKVTQNNREWPIKQSRFKAPRPKILSSLKDFGMFDCLYTISFMYSLYGDLPIQREL